MNETKYSNLVGLLKNDILSGKYAPGKPLPSWVSIEWSIANLYVQDVSYPANMTWMGALEAYGRMYGDAEATAEAAKMRETIFSQSFDGSFFRDHAKRWKDGTLTVLPQTTETCQNYALYFRLGDRKTPGGWYATVVNRLGGVRPYGSKELPKISKSAPFIGDALRLLALADLGEWEILSRDLKAFYLEQARRTGTLWETEKEIHSNCHGFAGAAADLILRCAVQGTAPTKSSVKAFCERAEKGERLTVAYFGGSLTWGANATDPNRTSWRARISERLEAAYPKAHFKFVDAAIGGTGSNLGVFRPERTRSGGVDVSAEVPSCASREPGRPR